MQSHKIHVPNHQPDNMKQQVPDLHRSMGMFNIICGWDFHSLPYVFNSFSYFLDIYMFTMFVTIIFHVLQSYTILFTIHITICLPYIFYEMFTIHFAITFHI